MEALMNVITQSNVYDGIMLSHGSSTGWAKLKVSSHFAQSHFAQWVIGLEG